MSQKLQHLIKPFSAMGHDEQLALIETIRHKRFTIRETKVKKAATRTARVSSEKRKDKAAAMLAQLSPEQLAELRKQYE